MPFVKRQNVHQTHFEDLVLLGPGGLEELDDKIEGMIDTLEDKGGKLNTTVKIDGAPALFCWSSYPGLPDNSISLKSFTKDTAANNCISSPEQIDQKYPSEDRANMREMLKYGLEVAHYIPAGECWQGDCLFTRDSKKEENIDGTDYITFQPNKIIYAFSEQNPGYEEVKNADFGIAFHTIYKGEDKKQSFNVDRSRLNVPSNIYVMSPALSVDTKSFNLNQIKAQVNKLHSLEGELLSNKDYETLVSNEEFMEFWNTFENKTLADKKQVTINEATFINELKEHIREKLTQKASKLKTEKGRAGYMTKIDELAQLVDNNNDLLTLIVKTLNEAAKIKMLLWEGFKQTKTGYDTYYKSRTKGYFKGDMEGIRMSDQDGNIVKIVDRTNFSSYNRDPDIVGGWERESLGEDYQSMLASGEDIMTVAFGRMSVPTIGHMKLVKFMAAQSKGVKARLYLSHKTGQISDPLPYEDKLYWCKKAFEPMIDVVESPLNSPLMILSDIYRKDGYTGNVLYVCGEDRLEEAKKWKKYNGEPDKKGKLLFDFTDYDAISAGDRNKNSSDLLETVSGTMVRQCVLDGDFDRFKKLVPFDENDAEDLYEELEESFKALGALGEGLEEAVFSKDAATNPKHTYFNDVIEYIIKNKSIKLGKQGERELDLNSFLTPKKVEELKNLLNTNDVTKFNAALSDVNVKWTDIFKGTFSGVKQSDVELMIAEAFNDINNESLRYHKIAKVLADAIGYAPQTGVTIGKLENKKGGRPTQEWKELGKYGDGKIDDTPKTDLLSSDEKWRISLKEGKGSQLMSGKFNETGSEALATLNAVFNKFPDKQYKIEDVLNVEDEELGNVFNINDVLKEFYEDEFLHSKNAVISDIKKRKSGTKEQQDKLLSISRRLDLFAAKLQKMCNDSTFKESFLREAATGETKFGPNSISTANCWFVYNNSDNTAQFYDSWESFYKGFIGDHSIKILVNFKSGGSGSVPWIVIRVLE